MKSLIFKALLSAFLLSLTLCSSIKTNRKSQTKKDDGSGSWDNGYDCPRINIAEGNGNYVSQGGAKIYAKNIVSPSTDYDKLGLVFDFSAAPGALLKKVGTLVSGNKYYIPYRYLAADIKYTNPSGNNKYLEGWFTDDSKKSYKIKIELPYKTFGWYINDDEAQSLVNGINKLATQEKSTVKSYKNDINTESSVYIQQKPLYDSALKNKDNLAADLKKKETELTTKKTVLDSLKGEIDTKRDEINRLKASISEKETQLTTSEDKYLSLNKEYNTINDAIQNSKNSGQSVDQSIADLKTKTEASSKKLTGIFGLLRSSAPVRKPEVDNAETGLKALNKNDVLTNLDKIYP